MNPNCKQIYIIKNHSKLDTDRIPYWLKVVRLQCFLSGLARKFTTKKFRTIKLSDQKTFDNEAIMMKDDKGRISIVKMVIHCQWEFRQHRRWQKPQFLITLLMAVQLVEVKLISLGHLFLTFQYGSPFRVPYPTTSTAWLILLHPVPEYTPDCRCFGLRLSKVWSTSMYWFMA